MEEIIEEVRSRLYSLYDTFSKARGEWNDGYSQGIRDALSILSEEKSKSYVEVNHYPTVDISDFKNKFFKKGYEK
jgi:hypothetical protein